MFQLSRRLQNLPPYLFVEIDKAKRKARQEGRDIIDLGVGDPDYPTPGHVIDKLAEAAREPAHHRYALDQGMPLLRQSIAQWYRRRFNVTLDPEREILPLIGSKEGIAHFPLSFLNNGDYALVPDPCYPPYKGGVIIADGRPYSMPLRDSLDFLPDLEAVPSQIRKKARIMFVNYPNNPTAGFADKQFYEKVVDFATRNNIVVISDLAYSEIAFDGTSPPSFLEVAGAKDTGIEFHSLSKTYNMTGWRVGWACGNERLICALAKLKSNMDSGIFSAIQVAAIEALRGPQEHITRMCALYKKRRDVLVAGLGDLGWQVTVPKATIYVWQKIPAKKNSIEFARLLLEQADIVVTPGVGFGESGEGYIRFALTVSKERIHEAVSRLKNVF